MWSPSLPKVVEKGGSRWRIGRSPRTSSWTSHSPSLAIQSRQAIHSGAVVQHALWAEVSLHGGLFPPCCGGWSVPNRPALLFSRGRLCTGEVRGADGHLPCWEETARPAAPHPAGPSAFATQPKGGLPDPPWAALSEAGRTWCRPRRHPGWPGELCAAPSLTKKVRSISYCRAPSHCRESSASSDLASSSASSWSRACVG